MKLELVNLSAAADADVARIAAAAGVVVAEVAAAYERLAPEVHFVPGARAPAPGHDPLYLLDRPGPDEAGVLGYHGEDGAGRVFFGLIPGGRALHDPAGRGESLAAVVLHEVLEWQIDRSAREYRRGHIVDGNGVAHDLVATEIADPVQELSYPVTLADGALVDSSNWVTPAWFDADGGGGRYDRMGALTAPLTLAPGGYALVVQAGRDEAESGRVIRVEHAVRMAAWRAAAKAAPGSRSRRRLAPLS